MMKLLFVAVLGLVVWLVREWYRLSHCPDCGARLGKLKENRNGWLYKECHNPECSTQVIGYTTLLES